MSSINIGKKNYKGKQEGVNDYVDYMVSRRMGEYEAHMKGEKNFHDAKKVIYNGSVSAENVEEAIDSLYESKMIAEKGLSEHLSDTSNPHGVTAEQVGLGNVDNTSDADKPVSTAQAAAIGEKTDKVDFLAHLADKGNPHAVTKASIGLSNADNTSDEDKPLSKAAREEFADNTRKWNAAVTEVSGRLGTHLSDTSNPHGVTAEQVGLGNVDNTSDADKPVSTAQDAALALKTNNEDFTSHVAEFSAHKTDVDAHEEAFAAERQRFNPIYCNALFGSADGANITVSDAVEGTPLALTLYGKCTETLTDSSAEKSPDNPATITGIGESGSVTVTVTDADGTAKEIAIPLSAPLYGIKHPTTGEWLARDEIRVEDGKVFLIRNIGKIQITENARNIAVYAGDKTFAEVYVIQDMATYGNTYGASGVHDKKRLAILSPLLKSGLINNNNTPKDIAIGYPGSYDRHICIRISRATLGVTSEATADEIKAAFKTWVSDYNSTHDIKFDVYYLMKTADTTDVTDTEAGQALLALVSQNGDTITNSESADMEITYNRDINKALAEINNAIIALGGTI